jgi:hypothetical protein
MNLDHFVWQHCYKLEGAGKCEQQWRRVGKTRMSVLSLGVGACLECWEGVKVVEEFG